jgi:hypothetical protein
MRKESIVRGLGVVVLLVLFGCSHSNAPSSENSNSGSSSSPSSTSSSTDNTAPPPAPKPAPIVIPAGKVLTVTVDQDISTKTNASGDVFAASLAEPVRVDGKMVIPAGTHATGTVVQAQAAGHLKGGALLQLTLDSFRLNGQKYSVDTSEFEEAGKGRGKRTAIGGGGGAAFGAIVGALAGGGKGAAIGALAGGGAGTAGAAYTGKRDITIPAETRLHFKLKDSLTINP